jgi:glucose-1-phosphate cytidylyltransferase
VTKSDLWINGGYFVMRSSFLDEYMRPGEDLVEEPLQRAIAAGDALAHRHDGFWAPMDTLKEKQWLEGLHESGQAPWELWANGPEVTSGVARLASA